MASTTPPASGGTVGAQERQISEADWQAIENDPDFQKLVREKRSFIVPATIFFLAFYFLFLIAVGYFPALADTNIPLFVNVAYLLALLQFVVGWVLMYLYVRRAEGYDNMVSRILAKFRGGNK